MGSHYRETALIVERKNESERHIERKLTKNWQKKKKGHWKWTRGKDNLELYSELQISIMTLKLQNLKHLSCMIA